MRNRSCVTVDCMWQVEWSFYASLNIEFCADSRANSSSTWHHTVLAFVPLPQPLDHRSTVNNWCGGPHCNMRSFEGLFVKNFLPAHPFLPSRRCTRWRRRAPPPPPTSPLLLLHAEAAASSSMPPPSPLLSIPAASARLPPRPRWEHGNALSSHAPSSRRFLLAVVGWGIDFCNGDRRLGRSSLNNLHPTRD